MRGAVELRRKESRRALFRIALARRSSRFSRSSSTILATGSSVTTGARGARAPATPLRNQFRNVAPGIPSWSPTWVQARLCANPGFSFNVSSTIRTARSRSSSLYFLGAGMTPASLKRSGPSTKPGAVQIVLSSAVDFLILASTATSSDRVRCAGPGFRPDQLRQWPRR
jgi:hypothetical protein